MADTVSLTRQVRTRVHDTADPPIYEDESYEDAIADGLSRVNFDLGNSYTLGTLPTKFDFLVSLRATIWMALVRAGEAGSDDVVAPTPPVQSLSVPNFSVSTALTPDDATSWLDLAEALEDQYDANVATLLSDPAGGGLPAIAVGSQHRISRRTNNRTGYALTDAPPARTVAAAIAAGAVTVTWNRWADFRFNCYKVFRAPAADMAGEVQIAVIADAHDLDHVDSPGAGDWWYRVNVEDGHGLKGESNIVAASI